MWISFIEKKHVKFAVLAQFQYRSSKLSVLVEWHELTKTLYHFLKITRTSQTCTYDEWIWHPRQLSQPIVFPQLLNQFSTLCHYHYQLRSVGWNCLPCSSYQMRWSPHSDCNLHSSRWNVEKLYSMTLQSTSDMKQIVLQKWSSGPVVSASSCTKVLK